MDSIPSDLAVGKRDQKLVIAVTTDAVVLIKDGRVASKLSGENALFLFVQSG